MTQLYFTDAMKEKTALSAGTGATGLIYGITGELDARS